MATFHPLGFTSVTADVDEPVIRHIGFSDLRDALRLGWEDFKAVPSHAIVLCVIYPVIVFCCGGWCSATRSCRCCFRSPPALP